MFSGDVVTDVSFAGRVFSFEVAFVVVVLLSTTVLSVEVCSPLLQEVEKKRKAAQKSADEHVSLFIVLVLVLKNVPGRSGVDVGNRAY